MNLKLTGGYTLIEVALYAAVVAMITTSVVRLGLSVVNSGAKSTYQQEVNGAARYIADRMEAEIRDSNGTATVTSSSVTLPNSNSAKNPTVITYDPIGHNVTLQQAGGSVYNLNSTSISVTNLTFANYSSGSLTKNIGFVLTVQSAFVGTSQIYSASATVESDSEVRSN